MAAVTDRRLTILALSAILLIAVRLASARSVLTAGAGRYVIQVDPAPITEDQYVVEADSDVAFDENINALAKRRKSTNVACEEQAYVVYVRMRN